MHLGSLRPLSVVEHCCANYRIYWLIAYPLGVLFHRLQKASAFHSLHRLLCLQILDVLLQFVYQIVKRTHTAMNILDVSTQIGNDGINLSQNFKDIVNHPVEIHRRRCHHHNNNKTQREVQYQNVLNQNVAKSTKSILPFIAFIAFLAFIVFILLILVCSKWPGL